LIPKASATWGTPPTSIDPPGLQKLPIGLQLLAEMMEESNEVQRLRTEYILTRARCHSTIDPELSERMDDARAKVRAARQQYEKAKAEFEKTQHDLGKPGIV